MSEHLETWIKARPLIAERWCQGSMARDIYGCPVDPEGTEAHYHCIMGAMFAVSRDSDVTVNACRAMAEVLGLANTGFPGTFNDTHPHAEVLAAVDRAIAHGRASRSLPDLLNNSVAPVPCKELA